jgi:hypothetical protein
LIMLIELNELIELGPNSIYLIKTITIHNFRHFRAI